MTHSYSAPSEEIHKCKWRSKETKAPQWLQDTGKTSTSRPGERIALPESRVGAALISGRSLDAGFPIPGQLLLLMSSSSSSLLRFVACFSMQIL